MFYAYIPLFSYMGANMGQMPAAAALRLLRLRLEIPAADRGTVYIDFWTFKILRILRKFDVEICRFAQESFNMGSTSKFEYFAEVRPSPVF